MKSSTIPLLAILGFLFMTLHIAAQPFKARQSQACEDINSFIEQLIKSDDATLPEIELLEADVEDVMEEIGCADDDDADLCAELQ